MNTTKDEYKNAVNGDMNLNEKIVKLGELNKLSDEGLVLFINTSSSVSKVAFGLVRNVKSADFLEGN